MPQRDYWWCIPVAKYGVLLFTESGAVVITDYTNLSPPDSLEINGISWAIKEIPDSFSPPLRGVSGRVQVFKRAPSPIACGLPCIWTGDI